VVLTAAQLAGPALAGEEVGTYFSRWRTARRPGCSGWRTPPRRAAGCTSIRGGRGRGGPAQVAAAGRHHAVDGSFAAGDPVDLVDADSGTAVARGLVNYDAVELPALARANHPGAGRDARPRL
jgi:glutamate 5-kinase